MKTKKKKKIIIGASIGVVVLILIIGSVVWAKSAKYRKFINAYENTINAESMIVKIAGDRYTYEIFGKGEDTIITRIYDDSVDAVLDNTYYYRDGEKEKYSGDANREEKYAVVADRNVEWFYEAIKENDESFEFLYEFLALIDLEYDELYEIGIGFIKDYVSNKDSVDFIGRNTTIDDDTYYFEIYIKDFFVYLEENYNVRTSIDVDDIPNNLKMNLEIELNGKYLERIECKFEDETEFVIYFSDVNEITKENSIGYQYIESIK